jgi:hypothetical protein
MRTASTCDARLVAPHLQRLVDVGGHPQAALEVGIEPVEQIGVGANTRGDDEVARDCRAIQASTFDLTQRSTQDLAIERRLDGLLRLPWNAEIVCQGIRRAQGNDPQRHTAARHSLQDIVYRTVAAAGKDGVTTLGHCGACLGRRFCRRSRLACPYVWHSAAQHFEHRRERCHALLLLLARRRVVQDQNLTHSD